MTETSRLKLPLLDAAQAQKHVTVNEALLLIDLLVGVIPVLDRTLGAPPAAVDGAVYILGGTGTGAWAGFSANDLALKLDGGWRRVLPSQGMIAAVAAEGGVQLTWSGTAWIAVGGTRALIGRAKTLTKANDASVAPDPVLQVALQPNATYALSLDVYFTAPAGPGFQYALTGPAAPIRVQVETRLRPPGGTAETVAGALALPGAKPVAGGLDEHGRLKLDVVIETGASGGVFAFCWAQQTANAAGVGVRAGSSLNWALLPELATAGSPYALKIASAPVTIGGAILTIGDH